MFAKSFQGKPRKAISVMLGIAIALACLPAALTAHAAPLVYIDIPTVDIPKLELTYAWPAQYNISTFYKTSGTLQLKRDDTIYVGQNRYRVIMDSFQLPYWSQNTLQQAVTWWTSYLDAYVKNGMLLPLTKQIVDVAFVAGSTKQEALSSASSRYPGYIVVNVDLNEGAGGKFIYLAYKEVDYGAANAKPIRNLFMEYRTSAASQATESRSHNGVSAKYTRNPQDLNQGAGGGFIYLWHSEDATSCVPIAQIGAVSMSAAASGEPGWKYVKWQNTNEAADCNKGAKGKFVYIKYR